jgi:hypothetical protein
MSQGFFSDEDFGGAAPILRGFARVAQWGARYAYTHTKSMIKAAIRESSEDQADDSESAVSNAGQHLDQTDQWEEAVKGQDDQGAPTHGFPVEDEIEDAELDTSVPDQGEDWIVGG